MNNDEAKFILRAYRPNGRDADDATFGEALRQAQKDPALSAWLAREQAFDQAVAAKLQGIAPPPGLREAILTGAHVSTAGARPRWRPAVWLAMAAAFAAVLGTATILWQRAGHAGPAELAQLTAFALSDPLSAHTGPHADKLGAFGAWLDNAANPMTSISGVNLGQLKLEGCRTLNVAGHPVFEICFQRGGMFHLYIGRRGDFAATSGDATPSILEQGGRSVATWAGQHFVYVVMTTTGTEALRRIL